MLIERTFWGEVNKIEIAMERLRQFCPDEGYHLAFSGGKDSIVVKALADMAGVRYDAHFCKTTVDPPEVLRFTRKHHADVEFERPKRSMWKLIVQNGPPTRRYRFCCEYLKEYAGIGRVVLTGIRWEESVKRKKRKLVETCWKNPSKIYVNPIIDWTTEDVWEFIKKHKIAYCSLYDKGFHRIGCVLCPCQSRRNRIRDVTYFPKFYKAYLLAFKRMLDEKPRKRDTWKTAEDVMHWWIYEDRGRVKEQLLFSMFE